nr:deoxyguanosinetriphosphate triphosphohydrolase [Actinomycetota bacterium]
EDAASAGVVDTDDLPGVVREAAGTSRSGQLDFFINALVSSAMETGMVAMRESDAEVLGALRSFNYERIYLRPESRRQSEQVIKVLRLLVEHLSSNPEHARHLIGFEPGISAEDLLAEVVIYVGGMTDRYAFETARELIGLDPSAIPQGIA